MTNDTKCKYCGREKGHHWAETWLKHQDRWAYLSQTGMLEN